MDWNAYMAYGLMTQYSIYGYTLLVLSKQAKLEMLFAFVEYQLVLM